jgi:hypothetical protein
MSNDRMASEKRIGKDAEESGRGLICEVILGICLKGLGMTCLEKLRKTKKTCQDIGFMDRILKLSLRNMTKS